MDKTTPGAQPDITYYSKIFSIPLIILIIQPFLIVFKVYEQVPWIDIPMHIAGALSIAISYIFLARNLQHRGFFGEMHPSFFFIFIVSLVVTTGLIWEIAEFVMDNIYTYNSPLQAGNADTMKDLFFAVVGGCLSFPFISTKKKET